MNTQGLSFEQLEIFQAVAVNGSINQAAEKLMIDQSAISRRLKALERDLDCQLFYRSSKGVALTAAGKILYQFSGKLFTNLSVLAEELVVTKTSVTELKIGSFDSVVSSLFPAFFTNLINQHGELTLSNDSAKLISDFNNGKLDALIVDSEFADNLIVNFFETKLLDEPFYLLAPISWQVSVPLSAKELQKFELFIHPSTCPIHRKLLSNFENQKLLPPVLHEIEFSASAISLAKYSGKAAILPEAVAKNLAEKDSDWQLARLDNSFDRHLSLFTRTKDDQKLLLTELMADKSNIRI